MMGWVLILWLWRSDTATMTNIPFASKAACEAAGTAARDSYFKEDPHWRQAWYICVAQK